MFGAALLSLTMFVLCVFLFSIPACAEPDTDISSADVFSLDMVGQTWMFQNALGDTTRIDVQPSLYASCAVLFITKSTSRAYWSPGSAGAKVQFEICLQSDGGWYSSRSIMSGDTDAGGSPLSWKATSNVGLVPSMPRAYQIIPPSGGSHRARSVSSKFRNYHLDQILTFSDITQNPDARIGDVEWETDSFVESMCVPYRKFCGNVLLVTQLEHCTSETELSDGCVRERWGWAPGLGLVSIDVLSASTTWDGLCTRDRNGIGRCYTFDQINIMRVNPQLN
jgi:hypothetical protein